MTREFAGGGPGRHAGHRPSKRRRRPGGDGEHELQEQLGSIERADRFYDEQMLDHLNARMREFVGRQEMCFLSTADAKGECDSSFRAGPPGFLHVLDERTVIWPEYRGNGVHASLGNIRENPHVGILMVDFLQARIGLHVNGRAEVVGDSEMRALVPGLPEEPVPGRKAQLWVRVEVKEAYIHCAKHIPHLQKVSRHTEREWGTDDHKRKGGDFFGTAREARRAEREGPAVPPAPPSGREPVSGPSETTLTMRMVRRTEVPGYRQSTAAGPPDPGQAPPYPSPEPAAVPSAPVRDGRAPGVEELEMWRRQAEEVLAAALSAGSGLAPFRGWFAAR